MKKLILTLTLCGIVSVAVLTPTVSSAQSSTSKTMADKEGTVKKKDGKIVVMTGGKWVALSSAKTLSDGSTVSTDGTVTAKNGTKTMLAEGDCVKPDGMIKKK